MPVPSVSSAAVNEHLNEYIKSCTTKINRTAFSNEKNCSPFFLGGWGAVCSVWGGFFFPFQGNDYLQLVNIANTFGKSVAKQQQ